MADKNGKDKDKTTGKFPAVRSGDLGEILVRNEVISIEQLDKARREIATRGGTLTQRLGELGITEDEIVNKMASDLGIPSVDLREMNIPPEILKLIPHHIARRYRIIPLTFDDNVLTVATDNPYDLYAMDDLKKMFRFERAEPVVTSGTNMEKALNEFYGEDTLENLESTLTEEELIILRNTETPDSAELEKMSGDENVVRYVNVILVKALQMGASDIHVESSEDDFRVRFRIDGMLREGVCPPKSMRNAIVSRIKIMSELKIDEHRLPQSGRVKFKLGTKEVDLRIEVAPYVANTEQVVMRILDKSALQLDMTRLGFDTDQLTQFKHAVAQPWGMVLVTGPTGSGKTTTLYSALMELNKPDVKILTVEDPVEITVRGISQMPIQDDIGRNFATALRSFLRQDPDIIMVGEIRDFETAEIAVKSAMTGHLVLSTLHTNDAPSTISRLLNMGIEPYLITSALNLIVAQRLVRVICKQCKAPIQIPTAQLTDLGMSEDQARSASLFHGTGCKNCNHSGYKSRLALFEVLPISEEIKDGILKGFSASELQHEAIRLGMQTLRQSGIQKILEGITTVEEVLRVTKK